VCVLVEEEEEREREREIKTEKAQREAGMKSNCERRRESLSLSPLSLVPVSFAWRASRGFGIEIQFRLHLPSLLF